MGTMSTTARKSGMDSSGVPPPTGKSRSRFRPVSLIPAVAGPETIFQ